MWHKTRQPIDLWLCCWCWLQNARRQHISSVQAIVIILSCGSRQVVRADYFTFTWKNVFKSNILNITCVRVWGGNSGAEVLRNVLSFRSCYESSYLLTLTLIQSGCASLRTGGRSRSTDHVTPPGTGRKNTAESRIPAAASSPSASPNRKASAAKPGSGRPAPCRNKHSGCIIQQDYHLTCSTSELKPIQRISFQQHRRDTHVMAISIPVWCLHTWAWRKSSSEPLRYWPSAAGEPEPSALIKWNHVERINFMVQLLPLTWA